MLVTFGSAAANLDPADTDTIEDIYVKVVGPPPPHVSDVAITIADKPDPIVAGGILQYRITVDNRGPGTASSISPSVILPRKAEFLSASTSQGTCLPRLQIDALICDLGALAADTSATVRVLVRLPQVSRRITATVSVWHSEPDPDLTNNFGSESTLVVSSPAQRAV
jgi:uncharacterized repeat protein (TIGR01451 family)